MVILAILVYWLAARGWQLRFTLPEITRGPFDLSLLRLSGGLESKFLRGALAFFLVALAARFYLGRFEMVWNQHRFMVGDRLHGRPFRAAALLARDRRADCGRGAGDGAPLDRRRAWWWAAVSC